VTGNKSKTASCPMQTPNYKVSLYPQFPSFMKKLLLIMLIACSLQAFAQNKVKSGVVYSQHPYMEVVTQLAVLYEKGDIAGMEKLYADTAQIYGMTRYDVDTANVAQWSVPPAKRLQGAKAGWRQIFDNWEQIKMRPIVPPEALEHTGGTTSVQSFWLLTLVNKKTKKVAKVEMVVFDVFNKAGKIATQVEFYDPTSLLAAMK
jgi:hypothetical protein